MSNVPHLSANYFGEFMVTRSAARRRELIRLTKRPGAFALGQYGEVQRAVRAFLLDHRRDKSVLTQLGLRLMDRAREAEISWAGAATHVEQDTLIKHGREAERCQHILVWFLGMYDNSPLPGYRFFSRNGSPPFMLNGMRISRPFDLRVVGEVGGPARVGGLTFRFGPTPEDELRFDACEHTAAVIQASLAGADDLMHMNVSHKLCIVLDVPNARTVEAPADPTEHLRNAESSSKKVVALWDAV